MIKTKFKGVTKIGVVFIVIALLLGVWVLISSNVEAEIRSGDFVLDDTGTVVLRYEGLGGDGITVPEGVVRISGNVFRGNTSVIGVVLPATLTTLEPSAFSSCQNLAHVQFNGSNLTEIPDDCFSNCNALSSISLPASITRIGFGAFANCGGLTDISIPAATSVVPQNAFDGCYSLQTININESNSTYRSYDGCIYSSTYDRLVMVPPGKSTINFEPRCTTIATGAFSYNRAIRSVTLPTSITTIEENAFSNSALETMTFPSSVTSIGGQTGWSPETIYGYSDSAAEYFAIEKGILFVVIGEGTDDPYNPDPTPDPTPTPSPSDPANPGTNNNATGGSGSGGNASVVINGATTPGSTTVISGGKDSTPKTADGDIDARWFLIGGLLLVGIAIMFYSRGRRFEYAERKRKSDLDS